MNLYLKILIPLLSLVYLSCGKPEIPLDEKPNLLLISVETLRADRLGCYGYERDTSPHVDGIAEEGVLFQNAFSASPKTTPSHMSIMTGLYPRVHNVYIWDKKRDGTYSGKVLSENIPTLAEILKENGYTNVAFTGGANVAGKIGFDRGFEIYDENGDTVAACRWLKENADKRFFLFYHTYYTHDPYLPPPPYDEKYDLSYSGGIPSRKELMEELGMREGEPWQGIWEGLHQRFWSKVNVNDPEDRHRINALYDGAINYVDNEFIGSLIDSLKAGGVLDKTLIVFTSDHGEEFLEHGRLRHDSIYREVARVPLIMRLPGVLPKGVRIEQLVRTIDIMPTILDLLGIPGDVSIQGTSLLPAIVEDKELELLAHADFNDYAPPVVESIRSGPWFLLMDQRRVGPAESRDRSFSRFLQLFDTEQDPGENRDLSETLPEVATRLQTRLKALRIESSRKHAEEAAEQETRTLDRENIERLKALGYL